MTYQEFRAENLAKNQARRKEQFRRLNPFCRKGQIVFAGSSLMEQFPVEELLEDMELDYCVYNRGNSGYVSSQMLEDLNEMVLDLAPSKLFINIGTTTKFCAGCARRFRIAEFTSWPTIPATTGTTLAATRSRRPAPSKRAIPQVSWPQMSV